MFCRNCGKEMPAQAVVCPSCGVAVCGSKRFCHHCGAEVDPQAAVCVKCGVKLAAAVPHDAKSKVAAGIMGIMLGGLGIHRFYLGYTGIGIAQILVTLFTCGAGGIWGFIEGIMILTGSINKDAQGRSLLD